MPETSKRELVIEVARTRVTRITKFNGFATDAGKSVFLGFAPATGPDDPTTAIAIRIGDDEIDEQHERIPYRLPLEIQALADASRETDAWMVVERILADIKRAFELTQDPAQEKQLDAEVRFVRLAASGRYAPLLVGFIERGQTVTLDRPEGSTVIGSSITYWLPLAEAWGTP